MAAIHLLLAMASMVVERAQCAKRDMALYKRAFLTLRDKGKTSAVKALFAYEEG